MSRSTRDMMRLTKLEYSVKELTDGKGHKWFLLGEFDGRAKFVCMRCKAKVFRETTGVYNGGCLGDLDPPKTVHDYA